MLRSNLDGDQFGWAVVVPDTLDNPTTQQSGRRLCIKATPLCKIWLGI